MSGISQVLYKKQIGDVTVINLYGQMSPAQKSSLSNFWMANGAIHDQHEAMRRTNEAVCLCFDRNEQIVGVNTCFPDILNTDKGPLIYWFYRQFMHPKVRDIGLSLAVYKMTFEYFSKLYAENGGPQGIALQLENPKLYKRSGRRVMEWMNMKKVGTDTTGKEIWVSEFKD